MNNASKSLVIAINALTTRGNAGVRSYLKQLAESMPVKYSNDRFVFFVNEEIVSDFDIVPSNVSVVCVKLSRFRSIHRLFYEQFIMPYLLYKKSVNVLYILAVTDIFLAPCPTIIRIGNMLPYTVDAMETQVSIRNIVRLNLLRASTALSRRTSDRTLVMSDAAASILIRDNDFDQFSTVGINRGVSLDSIFIENYSELKVVGKYILIVSHVSEYKCLREVVQGCADLGERLDGYTVVVAGAIKDKVFGELLLQSIDEFDLGEKIQLIGFVPHAQLGSLVKGAEICIFPSMVETCPVTLIEMMLCGATLIVSNQSVMPEICGDSVLYYDPRDSEMLANQLGCLLEEPELCRSFGIAAKKRIDDFGVDWDAAISRRYDLFAEVASQ